jgi:hypothetical protein
VSEKKRLGVVEAAGVEPASEKVYRETRPDPGDRNPEVETCRPRVALRQAHRLGPERHFIEKKPILILNLQRNIGFARVGVK